MLQKISHLWSFSQVHINYLGFKEVEISRFSMLQKISHLRSFSQVHINSLQQPCQQSFNYVQETR